MSSTWLYPLILIAGALQAWGPPMNGALRNALTNPWLASLVSFLPIFALQEDFKDLGGDTLDKLDVYIAHCDAVVHLVGDMTGSDPGERALRALLVKYPDLTNILPPLGEALNNGVGVSYTQWEAWLALYHGKLLLIAKAADSAERGPKYAPTGDSRAAQAAHLARLEAVERFPGCTFTSADNLAKYVLGGGFSICS